MSEENVVSKVGELMEALDNIKRYSAFARSLRKFGIILASTIVAYLTIRTFVFFSITDGVYLILLLLFLLLPVLGFVVGILYVRRNVNSVKTGEWKEELSQGFPAALKMLSELNWEKTFDEISVGRLGYALYGVIKTVGYWFVILFVLERMGNIASLLLSFDRIAPLFNLYIVILATVIVFLIVSNDLIRRYREIHALDMLLWELRGLSIELRRHEL
jgi:uncharacterized membrane protein